MPKDSSRWNRLENELAKKGCEVQLGGIGEWTQNEDGAGKRCGGGGGVGFAAQPIRKKKHGLAKRIPAQ